MPMAHPALSSKKPRREPKVSLFMIRNSLTIRWAGAAFPRVFFCTLTQCPSIITKHAAPRKH